MPIRILALLLAAVALVTPVHADPPPLGFGVVPQQAASKLARLWSPFLEEVSRRSGVPLRMQTAPDIPEFERRLAAGEYPFAYMNPYHYTVFSAAPGYRAIAREADTAIRGILVVRKDSPLRTVDDLAGTTIAFPAPAAFAATLLPQAELRRRAIPFTPKYVASHDSVYHTVAKGLYPVGGGVVRTFEAVGGEVRDQLRVLWQTPGYTTHPFTAHPDVDPALVTRVRDALVSLGGDEQGRRLLADLSLQPLAAADDSDWDEVRALPIRMPEPPPSP